MLSDPKEALYLPILSPLSLESRLLRVGTEFYTFVLGSKCAIFYFFGRKPEDTQFSPSRRKDLVLSSFLENYTKLRRFSPRRCICGLIFWG